MSPSNTAAHARIVRKPGSQSRDHVRIKVKGRPAKQQGNLMSIDTAPLKQEQPEKKDSVVRSGTSLPDVLPQIMVDDGETTQRITTDSSEPCQSDIEEAESSVVTRVREDKPSVAGRKASTHLEAHILGSNLHNGDLRKFTVVLKRKVVEKELRGVETYDQFRRTVDRFGNVCNFDNWRQNDLPDSCEYDVERLRGRLYQIEEARNSRDSEQMLRVIRTQLSRSVADIDRETLFHPFLHGTKTLIEDYTQSVCDLIADFTALSLAKRNKTDKLRVATEMGRATASIGKTALFCSGGGTFGMRHVGTIKCLFETGNLPRVICGSSAGAIVCAVLGSKTDKHLRRVLEDFCHGPLNVFVGDDEEPGWRARFEHARQTGFFFDPKNLKKVMRHHLGDITFLEAYELTGRILNISLSTEDPEGPMLLNYLTAPDVVLWSAVLASCALPWVFRQCSLFVKDPETGDVQVDTEHDNYTDGSLQADIPFIAVHDQLGVNRSIVCQVNPHVLPFLEDKSAAERLRLPTYVLFLDTLKDRVAGDVLSLLPIPSFLKKPLISVMQQRYSGHITILPVDYCENLRDVFRNPTPEFMEDAKRKGERATWQRLSIIEHHLKVEQALAAASRTLIDAL